MTECTSKADTQQRTPQRGGSTARTLSGTLHRETARSKDTPLTRVSTMTIGRPRVKQRNPAQAGDPPPPEIRLFPARAPQFGDEPAVSHTHQVTFYESESQMQTEIHRTRGACSRPRKRSDRPSRLTRLVQTVRYPSRAGIDPTSATNCQQPERMPRTDGDGPQPIIAHGETSRPTSAPSTPKCRPAITSSCPSGIRQPTSRPRGKGGPRSPPTHGDRPDPE